MARQNPHIPTGAAILKQGGVLHAGTPVGSVITAGPYHPAVGPSGFSIIVHGRDKAAGDYFFPTAEGAMRAFSVAVGKPAVYRAIQDYQIRHGASRVGVQSRGDKGQVQRRRNPEDWTEAELVAFLRDHDEITVSDLVIGFGGMSSKHSARLRALERAGTLVAVPGRKPQDPIRYRLAKQNPRKAGKRRNPVSPEVFSYRGVTFEVEQTESPSSGGWNWEAWALGIGKLANSNWVERDPDPRKAVIHAAKSKIAADPSLRDKQRAYIDENRDFLENRAGATGGRDALRRYDSVKHAQRRDSFLSRTQAAAGRYAAQQRSAAQCAAQDLAHYDDMPGPDSDHWMHSKRKNPVLLKLPFEEQRRRIWPRLHKLHAELLQAGRPELAAELQDLYLKHEHAPWTPSHLRDAEIEYKAELRRANPRSLANRSR